MDVNMADTSIVDGVSKPAYNWAPPYKESDDKPMDAKITPVWRSDTICGRPTQSCDLWRQSFGNRDRFCPFSIMSRPNFWSTDAKLR